MTVPGQLMRILGDEDQLLITPYQCNLLSLPIDIDRDMAADLIDLFGILDPASLLLGMPAFTLRAGHLSTEDLPGFDEPP